VPDPRIRDIPVDGGSLRALAWGDGDRVVLALHGITSSAMSWRAAGDRIPDGWTLIAPDLRGRGHSAGLPGPYGLDTHITDITTIIKHLGGHVDVLAGHSMGACVALLSHAQHPELASRLVLIDGGLALPVPDGADLDQLLDATLGPAITRLSQVFADEDAYVKFWQAHPALTEWTPDLEEYVRYDLRPADGGGFRSRADQTAVRADGRDLLTAYAQLADAASALRDPTPLLRAPAGMFGAPPGLLPDPLVQAWQERAPRLEPRTIPGVNHYTIMFAPAAVTEVVGTLTSSLSLAGSSRAPPSVHHERGPGRESGRRAAQERRELGDLLGLHEALDRRLAEQDIRHDLFFRDAVHPCLRGDLPLHQRCPDVSGADRVRGDPVRGSLQRDDLREPLEAVLGGHVRGLELRGPQPVHAGDVDDPAVLVGVHVRERGADQQERRLQHDAEHRRENVRRELLDGRDMLESGVVHQDVDVQLLAG
jgi:pimeloyl-ACP methyl ester carboxylesterase